MIHQSSYGFLLVFRPNDLRPEMYINKLGTTTQIFIAMDYFILMSEKYLHFKKKTKEFGKEIVFPPRSFNWVHVLRKYFSNYVYLKDLNKNLNEIGVQFVSKFKTGNFLKFVNF